jgi:hypothetical protein
MNIVSFGFRSVDDTPITQPNLTPSKEIKSKRRTLEGTYYSRNKEKVRQYYLDNIDKIKLHSRQYYMIHKKELAWGCKIYYTNNKKYFEDYRKRNYEKYKPHYRAYSFLKR